MKHRVTGLGPMALHPESEWCAGPRRPWWWWVAFGFYVSAVLTAFWVAYRALAGWPVDGVSLLSLVAG